MSVVCHLPDIDSARIIPELRKHRARTAYGVETLLAVTRVPCHVRLQPALPNRSWCSFGVMQAHNGSSRQHFLTSTATNRSS